MALKQPKAQLTQAFIERVDNTGLTDSAVAAAIGVTKQFYSAVKLGKENPTVNFMVGAVRAGLAETFSDVAEPATRDCEPLAA